MMTNTFIFASEDGFSLSLPPIATNGEEAIGTIDWGDGTIEQYDSQSQWDNSQTISHSYANSGEYKVIIQTTDFTTTNGEFCTSNEYLVSAELTGDIKKISSRTFYGASNLRVVKIPYGSIVENGSFADCVSLTTVMFGRFKVPSTTLLENHGNQAFIGCSNLKSISFYTDDTSLQNTTVSDYFISGSDSDGNTLYIPLEYKATYIPIVITDIPKSDYIIAYDMCETNFNHNGLRILSPTSGTITEKLNGDYSLTLEHPIDDDGAWQSLLEFNIIKALGQLFRIYKKSTKLQSSGLATRTVYAQHIFYDLAHKLIKSCDITGMAGQQALDTIIASIFDDDIDGAYRMYDFSRYSDITNIVSASTSYELTSPIACLIGEDNSFINRLGGELYRDNFYFSICNKKEGSQSNAFNIVHGINMLEVEEIVDYSEFCTYLHTEDNYQNMYAVAYVPSGRFPHNYAMGRKFNYNENNIEALHQDMTSYFEERWTPRITYTVKFANLKNAELYKDFINLANYNVGDTGVIYSEELGINTSQTIIEKTTDILTGETTSITLGNFPRSLTRRERYSNTITRADNIIDKVVSPLKGVNVNGESELQSLAKQGKLSTNAVYYDISGEEDSTS